LLTHEESSNEYQRLRISNNNTIELLNPLDDQIRASALIAKVYSFDQVFDYNATQSDVFGKTTKRLVRDIVDGYNATCFVYGATGAGKTYTYILI